MTDHRMEAISSILYRVVDVDSHDKCVALIVKMTNGKWLVMDRDDRVKLMPDRFDGPEEAFKEWESRPDSRVTRWGEGLARFAND